MKKFLKIFRIVIVAIIALLVIAAFAIQTSPIQNTLVKIVTSKLSKDLGTEVSIKHVNLELFNSLNADGILVKDKQKDTILYAGRLKVRITDWFFLKKSADLTFVGLEDAVIKLNRKDTVWNYDFIVKHFSSNTPKKQGGGLDIQLKKATLQNVILTQRDGWRGEQLQAKIGHLNVEIDSLLTQKNAFYVGDFSASKFHFSIYNFNGNRPKNYKAPVVKNATPATPSAPLYVKLNHFSLKESSFKLDANDKKPVNYFDGEHLHFYNINALFENTVIDNGILKSNIQLATKERCGFEVKKLHAQAKVTDSIIELAKLDIVTNKSKLSNYYAMKFKNFDDDFADYVNKVVMSGNFVKSVINSDDIAYFAPDLKTWHKELYFSGKFLGTVANFKTTNIDVKERATEGTVITGNLDMKGLPDIDKTFINFYNGNIATSYKDLTIFAPTLKKVTDINLAALNKINYKGDFKGTIHNFLVNGDINTSIGGLAAKFSMQLPAKKEATYKGNVSIKDFNVGKFANTTMLGIVNYEGDVQGKGFNIKTLNTKLNGKFKTLELNGYAYSNITTNASLANQFFDGEVKIDDKNASLTSQIQIDFKQKEPKFNILGDLNKSNLKPLNFTKEDLHITGLIDVVFSGNTIDNFLGSAKLLNARISNAKSKLEFDSLSLQSSFANGVKTITLGSNELQASVSGNFTIMDLPNSFQSFLNNYYPSYIPQPKKIPANQNFLATVATKNIEPYLQLFDKNISGFNDATLTGIVNTNKQLLNLNINIPFGKYQNYTITGADIIGTGNLDSLHVKGNIANIQLSDSLSLPNTVVLIASSKDVSNVSINTSANNGFYQASLNAQVTTMQEGLTINFAPSSFILNEKKWNLDKQGFIRITRNEVTANKVRFTQGFQQIILDTEENEGGNAQSLNIRLQNVVVGDLAGAFLNDPKLEGVATGTIVLEDFYGKFKANAVLNVEEFRLNEDSIGLAKLKANYSMATGKIAFEVESPNAGYNFGLDGYYNAKDSTGIPLNTTIHLNNSKIDLVQKFLGNDLFTNLSGYATGPITVVGKPDNFNILGKVQVHNTGLKVQYSQVYYHIDTATITFENDGINFGKFIIKDTLGNTGVVEGKLYEKAFKNMAFNFKVNTNKLLLLNTKSIHNQNFYGNVIGKAKFTLTGNERNAAINISGEPTAASHMYIKTTDTKETADANFIVFKQLGKEMELLQKQSRLNLSVALDLTANKLVDIDLILDELTGDVVKAKGDGRLKINAGTNENLEMRGRFNIDEGSYNFDFQSIARRPFFIDKNANNYIEWTGNPTDANVNLNAVYKADNISVSNLISNSSSEFSSNSRSYRGDVFVVANITGKLTKPSIKFKLDFPQNSPLKSDDVFEKFLQNIESDENEMLKQVTYLIAFNTFAPVGEGGGAKTNFANIGVNTISQLLTKELNKSLNNLIQTIFKDKSISVDFSVSAYNSADAISSVKTGGAFDRATGVFKLNKSFFEDKDKLYLTVGADLDIGVGGAAAQSGNLQWLPDLTLNWRLSKDNKFRAIFFTKSSIDQTGSSFGRKLRQGLGLSYKKDFNKSIFE